MSIESIGDIASSTSLSHSPFEDSRNNMAAFAAALQQNDIFAAQRALEQLGSSLPDPAGPAKSGEMLVHSSQVDRLSTRIDFPTLQSLLEAVQSGDLPAAKKAMESLDIAKGLSGWGSLVQGSVQSQPATDPASPNTGVFLNANA